MGRSLATLASRPDDGTSCGDTIDAKSGRWEQQITPDPRAELDRILDGDEDPADADESPAAASARRAAPMFAESVAVLMAALLPRHRDSLPTAQSLGIRLYAMLYLLGNASLGGRSIRAVSREARVTPAALSKHVVTFSDRLGFVGGGQKNQQARAKLRQAQTGNTQARDARERGRVERRNMKPVVPATAVARTFKT